MHVSCCHASRYNQVTYFFLFIVYSFYLNILSRGRGVYVFSHYYLLLSHTLCVLHEFSFLLRFRNLVKQMVTSYFNTLYYKIIIIIIIIDVRLLNLTLRSKGDVKLKLCIKFKGGICQIKYLFKFLKNFKNRT